MAKKKSKYKLLINPDFTIMSTQHTNECKVKVKEIRNIAGQLEDVVFTDDSGQNTFELSYKHNHKK